MINKIILLEFLNKYLAIATLFFSLILILLFIILIINKIQKKENKILIFLKDNSLIFGFLSVLIATSISLVYSEFLGIVPCGLCWFQRIFIYSQIFIFLVAIFKNDFKIFIYTFWLSLVGWIIALYHELLQIKIIGENIPCPSSPGLVDCSKPDLLYYGFITIPFMSLIIFSFLIFLSILNFSKNKKSI